MTTLQKAAMRKALEALEVVNKSDDDCDFMNFEAAAKVGDAIESLRAALAHQEEGGGCTLAGPGRGDCEHFVGLPGMFIPGQHDGPDDTVDAHGKPNGWCWQCWKSHKITNLEAALSQQGEQPVAEVYRYGKDSHNREWYGIHWYNPNLDVPTGTKLYIATPVVQP